ncbi:MAG: hypothetical protein AAGA85_01945 [Bacteroidota bacterium]
MRNWLAILILFSATAAWAQTCCSGGVPLAANIGFPAADKGTLQTSLSHDLNVLRTLKSGTEVLDDDSRLRRTHTLLFSAGYTFTPRFSFDISASYVWQRREISRPSLPVDLQQTHGWGDLMLLAKYQLTRTTNDRWNVIFGAGTKLANAATSIRSDDGIVYNLDLQPGSGAVDAVLWGLSTYSFGFRPSMTLNTQVIARLTGAFDEYLGTQSYEIGNNYRLHLGVSEQLFVGKTLLNTSLTLMGRWADHDRAENQILENTGGEWIFLSPEIRWPISPSLMLSFQLEIPIYANIRGEQLSTTYRTTTGVYFVHTPQKETAFDFLGN